MHVIVTGRMSFARLSAYCLSKYGVEAFSDALRREMSPWGVLVSMIEPGLFKTSISDPLLESLKRLWYNLSPEMKKDYGEDYFQQGKPARGHHFSLRILNKLERGMKFGCVLIKPTALTTVKTCFSTLRKSQP